MNGEDRRSTSGRGREVSRLLARSAARSVPTFRWATVTSVAPLEAVWDGPPAAPIPVSASLAACAVGDRVLLLIWGRRQIVLGAANGGDTGWLGLADIAGDEFRLADGYEQNATYPVMIRRIGNRVKLRGLVQPVGGDPMPTAQVTLLHLPPGFRPGNAGEWFAGGTTTGVAPDTLVPTSSGVVQYRPSPGASPYVSLSNIDFYTD